MSEKLTNCQNCEEPYVEHFEFCPHCGQKTKDELTIGVLFYNTISNYFSFDARFFKSFLPLLFRPGYLAKRFIEGKRLLYLHPAQLYLFVSVIFFFLYSPIIRDLTGKIDKALLEDRKKGQLIDSSKVKQEKPLDSLQLAKLMNPLKKNQALLGLDEEDVSVLDSVVKSTNSGKKQFNTSFGFDQKEMDSIIATGASDEEIYKFMGMDDDAGMITQKFYKRMLKFYKERRGGAVLQSFYDSIPVALFILLPIFAFLLKIFFYKRGRFAHHLVFGFYYFSFLFTVFILIILINKLFDIPDWIDGLLIVSTFIYLMIAIRNFYKQGWFVSWLKTSVITFLYFFVVVIAIVGVLGYSFLYY